MTEIDLGRDGFITLDETLTSLREIVNADPRLTVAPVGSGALSLAESEGDVVASLDGVPVFVISPTSFRGGWRTADHSSDRSAWRLDLDTGQPVPGGWGTTVQIQVPGNEGQP